MKIETLIFDNIRAIMNERSIKDIFFVGITKTSATVFFYSYIEGKATQCYTLVEQDFLEQNEMEDVFSELVKILRDSKLYIPEKYNVGTIVVDKLGIKLDMRYHDMDASEYQIQKAWKQEYVV